MSAKNPTNQPTDFPANGDCRPASCSLREATIAVLGGVAAISEDLYTDALEQIAEMSGRENTAEMWQDVDAILNSLPCPID